MKLFVLALTVAGVASVAQAAEKRHVVIFKSEQGYQAMDNYYKTTESAAQKMEQSLENVQAIVLKSATESEVQSLRSHPEVAVVEAEFMHPSPKPLNGFRISRVNRYESLLRNRVPRLRSNQPKTPWGINAVKAGQAWRNSDAGLGARVMILDTGVDKDHPALKRNFEAGKNFVEENGEVNPALFDDKEGHGTHVAGTIAGAYDRRTGFTGVAPSAKFLMGRVCGAQGCSSIAIIEGINWGIKKRVDVISMSLGGPVGSPAEQAAVEKADRKGIVVVAASGNGAGHPEYSPDKNQEKCLYGMFLGYACGVSFPAAFPTVIAVGALDSNLAKTNFSQWGPELDIAAPGAAVVSAVPRGTGRESVVEMTVNGSKTEVKSAAFSGAALFPEAVVKDLVAVPGLGKPEDFATVDVQGKIALISRGEIKFVDKVQNALAKGAAGVIIYNNTAGLMQGSLSEDDSLVQVPVVMIEQELGQSLVGQLARGVAVQAAVTTAPSDYASFDGTSMATPHVAGVIALMKAANPNLRPARVRSILAQTARRLAPNDTNQLGAGVVQADQAVRRAARY